MTPETTVTADNGTGARTKATDATPVAGADAAPPPNALEVENLTYSYGRGPPALDRVSLTVPEASFTALLGPNGAGKTTLMSLVTRLFVAREGRIVVCGHDLRRAPRLALAAMGVVFQQLTLDLDLDVVQNLRYAAALQGLPRRVASEHIEEGLARMGFADRRGQAVRRLSGGYRRRVELARALLHRPRLLVLDEPTVGLDIESRRDLVDRLHELCRSERIAVLWTTHLIDEVRPGDRVVVLAGGRVRAAGTEEAVRARTGAADLDAAFRTLVRDDGA